MLGGRVGPTLASGTTGWTLIEWVITEWMGVEVEVDPALAVQCTDLLSCGG